METNNLEKGCTWHFKPEGGSDIGPNDPLHIMFKGNPYYSIVREAIQNSLDVVNDSTKPVHISFQYFDLNRLEYPSFFQIEGHINQSMQYYESTDDAKYLFGTMLDYLNGTEKGKKRLKLTCLKISDYNTTGMHFNDGTDSPFYNFLRNSGGSSKNAGSGGSFGFGKGAYFALSPIKTLIVSSKDTKGNVYFEGATRLTTHKDTEGNKISATGYYDNNGGNPTTDQNNIPEIFKRQEMGTDINIIGLWDDQERKKLMIKSVLNNFWLAIYDQKLIVQVEDVIINKENIETKIGEFFEGQTEGKATTDIESWNPMSYLKAVKYSKTSEQFLVFEENLNTIGNVKLYVYLEKNLPNRISYFRTPRMVVYKRTDNKVSGYSAVFICDNIKGSNMLRGMENPAHNEWKLENYRKVEGKIDEDARKGYKEITDFVNNSLESLAKIKPGNKIAFVGLEEYLSIPEDLLEKDEEYDFEGQSTSNIYGQSNNENTEVETGMVTSDSMGINIKPTVKTQRSEAREETGFEVTEEGDELMTSGGENETDGGNSLSSDFGDTITKGNRREESLNNSWALINVNLRVAAQRENGCLFHHLIINSQKEIENAELELLVGSDNDRDERIEILSSDKGIVSQSSIKNLKLAAGVTKIKIRFADNIKHSVKIKAYELQ
jgi:hypothetical protein